LTLDGWTSLRFPATGLVAAETDVLVTLDIDRAHAAEPDPRRDVVTRVGLE
jgi:hypothetical protein